MAVDSPRWWEGFFDADYVRLWGPRFTAGEDEAASLWRILSLSPGCRLLDAPCGYGRVSEPLARLGAYVLGVDQSAPLLDEAERRRGDVDRQRLRFLHHDLRMPLAEAGFDAALNLFTSLGYGTEADDLAILGTLAAAVRAGGTVAIDIMPRDAVAAMIARETTPAHRLPDGTLCSRSPASIPSRAGSRPPGTGPGRPARGGSRLRSVCTR